MTTKTLLNNAQAEIDRLKEENNKLKIKLRKESSLKIKNKQLQEQLNLLIESSGLGTWDHDRKTDKVIRSEKWATQLGYKLEELKAEPTQFFDLVHPADLKKIKTAEQKHASGEEPFFKTEHRMKAKDGKWKWILNSGKIIKKDKHGNPLRIIGTHLDITNIKEYQQRLGDRERQYRALFEYAPIGLWEQDITELSEFIKELKRTGVKDFNQYFADNPDELNRCIVRIKPQRINKTALDIHDATSLNEIKNNFDKIFTPRSKVVFKDQIIAYAAGEKFFEADTETRTLKGNLRKLRISISYKPLPVKNRKVILFSLFDITEQIAAEKELKQSEQRYRTLFKFSPMGILIESPNGKILDANPALHSNFGYKENELVGKNIKILAHPQMHRNIKENINAILNGIELKHIVKGIKADGTPIFNELYETKVTLSKIGDAVLCLSSDITQQIKTENRLKENEQHYRSLFYKNPLPMYIFNKDTYEFLDINQSALVKYGYTRKEISKMTILDIRPKEEVKSVKQDISDLKTGLERRGIWRHKKKNGKIIYVDITANSIEYFGTLGVLVLANDVTERLNAEKKLEKSQIQMRKFADHLERVREEERTNIAREIHDNLGQSLTAVKIDLSWLDKRFGDTDNVVGKKITTAKGLIDQSIETIQKISTALRPGIIDDLGLQASLEWFIDDFIERTNIDCSLSISLKNANLNRDLSINLYRIIQEALTNIVRHSEATRVSINLSDSKRYINLLISDNGRGITSEQINKHNSFGIIGMQERVIKFDGSLKIGGIKNKGTKIKIRIPQTNMNE